MSVLTATPLDVPAAARSRIAPLLRVVGADQCVPLVTGDQVRYVQFDNAASAPALESVAAHVSEVLPYYASVHRGAGLPSQLCTRLYEEARHTVGAFVGARADDVVVFTRNTTDALNLLSSAVPGEVVVLDIEHHANLISWQRGRTRIVSASSTLAATETDLAGELSRRPAALLAVTGASNVTGEVPDLVRLAELAHRHGARIVVDAAQLLPHRTVDLAALGVDYLAFSGHKLYAPFGAGVLVGRRDWLDGAVPHLAGGGAVREVTVTQTQWAPAPERHEGGTPNVLGVAAIAAACRALAGIDPERRIAHERTLHDQLVEGLRSRGIEPLRIWSDPADVVGVVSFTVAGRSAAEVAAYLSAEHGIGVRDGRFCAHPLVARLAAGTGAVRVSLGVGSCSADIDRLLRALDQLLIQGPAWTYAEVAGRCQPCPDPRPLPKWLPTSPVAPAAAGTSPCGA